MKRNFISRSNDSFAAIAGWSYDHRWWVTLFALLVLAISLFGAAGAQVDASYESYFDPRDPIYVNYTQFREDFGSDEISYILYEVPNVEHGVFDYAVMQKINRLTETLESEVPFIDEVTSLTSVERMVGVDDGIEIRALRDDFPKSQEELLALRKFYVQEPLFVGGIVSADAQYGAVIIEMERSSTDALELIRFDPEAGDSLDNLYPQVTDFAIKEILARPEYAEFVFHHSGDVPLNAIYNVIIGEESIMLGAATAAVVALVLLFFFRSAVGVLAPTFVVQLSVVGVVAFIAMLDWGLDLSFSSVPTLLTAIGVAHSVHTISEFRSQFVRLGDRREALVQTLYLVGTPCMLTSVTTAIGFAAMSFVPIKSIAHMGVYSAFGVIYCFLLSLTLLLALLSFGSRTPDTKHEERQQRLAKGGLVINAFLGALVNVVIRWRRVILVIFSALFAVSVAGIMRVNVDANWLNDFRDDMPLKVSTVIVDDVMGGVTNLVLLLDTGSPGGIKSPAALAEVERLQSWANSQDLVRKTYSVVDILKDLNQTFNEEDPAYYRIPESRNLVAQYLLLYENAGGTEAQEYVSADYQRARLELRLRLDMSSEYLKLIESLENELAQRPLQQTTLSVTGIGALWLKLLEHIVTSQITGFLLAFSIIAVLMCLVFRSVTTGLISMIPNLSPVLLTLGVMGWLEIDLDYSKAVIAAVALGIAVDDTIHLMSRYRYEFARCGNYAQALRVALSDVGRALLITSVALVLGFMVLLSSMLQSQATQGLLLATTIITALVADFLLMPALVLTFQPFGPEGVAAEADNKELL